MKGANEETDETGLELRCIKIGEKFTFLYMVSEDVLRAGHPSSRLRSKKDPGLQRARGRAFQREGTMQVISSRWEGPWPVEGTEERDELLVRVKAEGKCWRAGQGQHPVAWQAEPGELDSVLRTWEGTERC